MVPISRLFDVSVVGLESRMALRLSDLRFVRDGFNRIRYFEGRSKRGSFAARRMTGRLGLVPGLVANGVVGTKEAWIASQGLAMTGAVG